MTGNLPKHPSLENLKKQAKTLLRKWKAGDAEAAARVRAMDARVAEKAEKKLADCQMVVAREHGFESWPQLKVAVEAAQRELAEQFVELACLCYDDPHFDFRTFPERAHALLKEHPELAEENLWAAAAAGNAEAVARILEEEPGAMDRPGPHGWAPLLCACYSRVKPIAKEHSTFEVARLLLERGADANAHTWKYNDPPGSLKARKFTALTGMFGNGSTGLANQPSHPEWKRLAELLLKHGASPADERGLWIHANVSLGFLLEHGLGPEAKIRTEEGEITLLGRELGRAAQAGRTENVRLLLKHGARVDEIYQGATAWEHAIKRGYREAAELLAKAGAETSELNEVERFTSVVLAGDETEARRMLENSPNLKERAMGAMVNRATNTRRIDAVRLALDLGFDPDFLDEVAAMHNAAGGAVMEILRLLVERGASPKVRDPFYDGTPAGWAEFYNQKEARDYLLREAPIGLLDALEYGVFERVPEILQRDPEAIRRTFAEELTREPRDDDHQTPLIRMLTLGKREAARELLKHGADATERHPDGRTALDLAKGLGDTELVELLERHGAK